MGYFVAISKEGDEWLAEIWIKHEGVPRLAARFLGPADIEGRVLALAPTFVARLREGLQRRGSGTFHRFG